MRPFIVSIVLILALAGLPFYGPLPLMVTEFRHVVRDGGVFAQISLNDSGAEVRVDGDEVRRLGPHRWEISYGAEASDNDGLFDVERVEIVIRRSFMRRDVLQIDRQSPAELFDAYGLEKPDGYSVIAASTIDFSGADSFYEYDFPDGYGFVPAALEIPETSSGIAPEVRHAAGIMTWLDDQGLTFAPMTPRPQYASLRQELAALSSGKDGLQCGDYRIVFTAIALEIGLEIRWVGLLSIPTYGLEDAVPYSHAALEVKTDRDGWVYFDPWNNLAFRAGGTYLSGAEVRAAMRRDLHAEPIHVVPGAQRSGRFSLDPDAPIERRAVEPPDISFYRRYFGVVETMDLR